jgi:hypothetical protein
MSRRDPWKDCKHAHTAFLRPGWLHCYLCGKRLHDASTPVEGTITDADNAEASQLATPQVAGSTQEQGA